MMTWLSPASMVSNGFSACDFFSQRDNASLRASAKG
jgi:hypothetical protein